MTINACRDNDYTRQKKTTMKHPTYRYEWKTQTHTSAEDQETNHTTMAMDWHPSMGFTLLTTRLFHRAIFANLAKHAIPNKDIVDIGIHVLHCTGLFAEEDKSWIKHGNDATNIMDFASFCTFWEDAVNIMSFTTTPASQHGYGMNAAEDKQF